MPFVQSIIREGKVSVEGKYYNYETSPNILNGYNERIRDSINNLVNRYKDSSYQISNSVFSKPNKNFNYKTLYEFTIKNDGDISMEDLLFESGLGGYYKVISFPKEIKTNYFENNISLGDLRPTHSIKIYCWTDNPPVKIILDNIKVTYKNGSIKVYFLPTNETLTNALRRDFYEKMLLMIMAFLALRTTIKNNRVSNKKLDTILNTIKQSKGS